MSCTDNPLSSFLQAMLQGTHPQNANTISYPLLGQPTCTVCGKQFNTPTGLKMHEKRHQGVYSYHCTICGLGFNSTTSRQGHMASKHNTGKVKCKICGGEFTRLATLKRHMTDLHSHGGGGVMGSVQQDGNSRRDCETGNLQIWKGEKTCFKNHCGEWIYCVSHLFFFL